MEGDEDGDGVTYCREPLGNAWLVHWRGQQAATASEIKEPKQVGRTYLPT